MRLGVIQIQSENITRTFAQNGCRGVGLLHWRLSHEIAGVSCPCAFRLRRFAQSVGRSLIMALGRGILLQNSTVKLPFKDVHADFNRAGSHKVWVVVSSWSWGRLGAAFSVIFFRIKLLLWHVHVRSLRDDLVEILAQSSTRSLRALAQFLMKSFVGTRVKYPPVLSGGEDVPSSFFTIEWSQHNPKNCKFSHYRMVPFFQARPCA